MDAQIIITIFIILAVTGAAVYWLKFRKAKIDFKVYSDRQERTVKGVLVCSKSGVSNELKAAIDEEFMKLFNDIRHLGYQNGVDFNYVIYILHDFILSPESGTRCFKIRADDYNGTVFDQNPDPRVGEILAAEMVINNNMGDLTNSYVVCLPPNVDNEFRDAVRFGLEHLLAYRNSPELYEATKFHGNGSGHPIYPRT